MLAKKHEQVNDKGLYWERIKMEIRAFTIAFSKKKAKRKRDEESILLSEMMRCVVERVGTSMVRGIVDIFIT